MSSDSKVKSFADIDVQTCEHAFTVIYQQYRCQRVAESTQFYAKNNNSVKWRLRLTPTQMYGGSGNRINQHGTYDDMDLQIMASSCQNANVYDNQKYGAYGGEVWFCVDSSKPKVHGKGTFILNEYSPNSQVVYRFPFSNGQFTADFTVKCEITFFKLRDTIPLFISHIRNNTVPFEVTVSDPLKDFGKLYLSKELSDVTLCIKLKGEKQKPREHPAHKIVLTARSKVFEAMFKHDMKEKQLDRVIVEGIREEVFLEALRYIYTGKVQNLDALVYDLLPVADRYDLEKLRIMCGDVLRKKLSVDTALQIVTLADMYNVDDLKKKATQFIKDHSADVSKKMDSKAWKDLMSRPHLMKDLLMSNMN